MQITYIKNKQPIFAKIKFLPLQDVAALIL